MYCYIHLPNPLKGLLIGIAILLNIQVNAQNYLITFAGKGASNNVHDVRVENLTSGETLMLHRGEILRLIGLIGISPPEENKYTLILYPNPVTRNDAVLRIYPPDPGNALIIIYGITGKIEAQSQFYLGNYPQEYRLSGLKNGLHLINVVGGTYHYSGKLVCSANAEGAVSIDPVNGNYPAGSSASENEEKRSEHIVNMRYTDGDRLKFTGISGRYRTVKMDIPDEDKTISFNFFPCTDGDNNNYSVVEIASQVWMAENLKTTLYDNGNPIEYSDSRSGAKETITTGTYTWYENNKLLYGGIYGALYNWYAVSSGNLCPAGWHIPERQEWLTLQENLGGAVIAGTKIKESGTLHWAQDNEHITNESGFSALPGGYRVNNDFIGINHYGFLWSSDPKSNYKGSSGWYINSSSDYLIESQIFNENDGLSIRCLLGESPISIPEVLTSEIKDISAYKASTGGFIKSFGGTYVTAQGVCWSVSENPTTDNNKTVDETDNPSFTSSITGLEPGTTYHVRAYSTNRSGTAYGADLTFTTPLSIPVLSTGASENITRNTAIFRGTIISIGGTSVITSGICWSTSLNPTVAGSHTTNITGSTSFTGSITGLTANTVYFVRAYATNSSGTGYGNLVSFTTKPNELPTITTTAVSSLTSTTAISGGNITDDGGSSITACGICMSTNSNPAIADSRSLSETEAGSFTSNLTGLEPGTVYYIRAFATNSTGTAYGAELTFTTSPHLKIPTLTTTSVTSISSNAAESGGNITDDGGSAITARGICLAIASNPTISDVVTLNGTGTGSFTSNLTGLEPGNIYHIRAYATNSMGTAYGTELTFTASAVIPILTTSVVSAISRTTATSGGTINSNGGAVVTVTGICWGTSHNPSISGYHTAGVPETVSFTGSMNGLLPATMYYVRAYAANSSGTGYGNEVSFTTDPVILSALTTNTVTSVTTTSAISGGNISDNGGGTITARGVCWAITSNPTISDTRTSNGTTSGSFTSNITGLQPGTTYHVRAYSTNSAGTAYGTDLTFTTSFALPVLTTSAVNNITRNGASSGGTITSNGGASVILSGICWSTSSNPTIAGSHTTNGTVSGSFTSSMTAMTANTVYYVRAYATNSVGTSYGNEISFRTLSTSIATLATTTITLITSSSAGSGGNITDNGGAPITDRGICWGLTSNPTIQNFKIAEGTGTGSFTGTMTQLQPEVTYYVRAYATNSHGIAYGSQLSFTTLPKTNNDVSFYTSAEGLLLHSVADKRIIYKTIGSENYIKYSSDNGNSFNQGVNVTGVFTENNNARILGNGIIVLFCDDKIYYSYDNLTTITQGVVLNKNGVDYVTHNPVNAEFPGGYFHFMGGYAENDGVIVMGNYTNNAMGASPVNLYYSLDGITWKVFYTFGQDRNYTDNGTAMGGRGGILLGDPDNPLIARHVHAVSIGYDGNFYACTGDSDQELHFMKCSYNKATDTWTVNDLLAGESINWQRMRALGVYERNGYLYWGSDGLDTFIFEGVQYDSYGIYKCAVEDINDPSKHILLQPLTDACYSFVNYGNLVFSGLQSYKYVYISYDYGETWNPYQKPSWMHGSVQGVWYNELYKYFTTNYGVLIESGLF